MDKMLVSKVTIKDLVNVHYNRYQSTVEHSHNFFELMYVEEGSLVQSVNSLGESVMEKGDYMIMDRDTIHKYTGENLKIINMSFMPCVFSSELDHVTTVRELLKRPEFGLKHYRYLPFPADVVLHDYDGKILSVIKTIWLECEKSGVLSHKIHKTLLTSLLLQILESHEAFKGQSSASEITDFIIKSIDTDYASDNLLVAAAKKLNYSLSYLSYTFKKDVGIPFKEYLQKYRMEVAAKLLEETEKPVYEISGMVGYGDLKCFNNIFKRCMEMTPTQYRKVKKLSKELKTDVLF